LTATNRQTDRQTDRHRYEPLRHIFLRRSTSDDVFVVENKLTLTTIVTSMSPVMRSVHGKLTANTRTHVSDQQPCDVMSQQNIQ